MRNLRFNYANNKINNIDNIPIIGGHRFILIMIIFIILNGIFIPKGSLASADPCALASACFFVHKRGPPLDGAPKFECPISAGGVISFIFILLFVRSKNGK